VLSESVTPLLDCDRQTRIRAAERLPEFLKVIASELESAVEKLGKLK
jgi:hypothetical protein